MSYLPQFKIGDCSIEGCGLTNTQGRKVGKNFICLSHYTNAKRVEQMKKATERNRVRSLRAKVSVSDSEVLDERVQKEKWFAMIRTKLTGTCQCGCGNKSSKADYKDLDGKIVSQFRSSICHIFPKCEFYSIKYHPLNYVERAFWGGCHSVMDDTSMDRWVNMADWDDIKEKFYVLAPLLTEKERASKFYSHLERLVYSN